MRRTLLLVVLAAATLAAAAVAALLRPPAVTRPPSRPVAAGALRLSTQLDRRFLPEQGGGEAYLQIDLVAGGERGDERRVPVNAVIIIDRSGSMSGAKIERARDAARALVDALGEQDRLAIVEFSSSAAVALHSTPMTASARERALSAIAALYAGGGTNMSAAFDAAAPELQRGRSPERVDKVFLASDGEANEGIHDRRGLLQVAQRDFGPATVSTFGIGEDYDEDLMSALAAQAGGRARYIDSPEILPRAFQGELSRAKSAVARDVRVRVSGLAGVSVERVLGYPSDGGWVRVPDFAAGEERRVLVKLSVPSGRGITDLAAVELQFEDAAGAQERARSVAQATFTSDRGELAQAPTAAAVEGAKAEMAELAEKAARLQEEGRRAEAKAQVDQLKHIAVQAAAATPAEATALARAANEYDGEVSAISGRGSAASKKLKERTFDAVRAPVAGW
ncbi:MAG: VWA domain-containing protein [Deltaproteobacteria bacterium]|nr:MAG: VWA domain-containing protein [Deltaproteobacteria bacterium]